MTQAETSRERRSAFARPRRAGAPDGTQPRRGQVSHARDEAPAQASDSVVTTALARKLTARRARVRRSRRLVVASLIGAVALVALVVWGLFFSPLFALSTDRITVAGAAGPVRAEDVRAPLLSYAGTPLPRLDRASMGEDVVTANPWVQAASVEAHYPHGVDVTVEMATPAAVSSDGELVVTTNGNVIERGGVAVDGVAEATTKGDIPLQEAAPTIAAVATALSPDLAAQVKTISYESATSTLLTLDSGSTVAWGSSDDSELKGRVLATLVQVEAATYDLTDPLHPTTK